MVSGSVIVLQFTLDTQSENFEIWSPVGTQYNLFFASPHHLAIAVSLWKHCISFFKEMMVLFIDIRVFWIYL